MARTSPENVSGIVEVDEDIDLIPFIDTATELVTECCSAAGYTATRLELIERWLAAHMYRIRDKQVVEERADVVLERFDTKVGLGLDQTPYGQQAKLLDTYGGLAALDNSLKKVITPVPVQSKALKVGVTWLGTKDCR